MSATITPETTRTTTNQVGASGTSDHARGFTITSFVLGIASVVSGWTFFAPIAGLIFGIVALRRGTPDRTLALWGVWLNAAMLALWAIAAVIMIALFGFGALVVTSSAG